MKRPLIALALLLALPLSVAACLWDRDTPADEAKGLPEVIAVLTGRFPRNPPLYYEMRLARVASHLESHPGDLDAYDDAGVACDRLGRGDEAIAWMEKKRQQLEKLDAKSAKVREHQYRYHANLGTFVVHRWVRQGRDRKRIEEVKRSRDEIAAALKINPNAHFGREKYQLKAIEWIIDSPRADVNRDELPNLLGWDQAGYDRPDPKAADDAVRGLAGLVVLGNAWESVDIFHTLIIALQHDTLGFQNTEEGGRNTLAYLAWLRCRELIDGGKRSMLPDAPDGLGLIEHLRRPHAVEKEDLLNAAFLKLRAEADAWQAARTAFMTRRLNQGSHPDTDPEFWNGYTEKPAPGLPTSMKAPLQELMADRRRLGLVVAIALPVLALAFVVGIRTARWARERRARRRKVRSSRDALDHVEL